MVKTLLQKSKESKLRKKLLISFVQTENKVNNLRLMSHWILSFTMLNAGTQRTSRLRKMF